MSNGDMVTETRDKRKARVKHMKVQQYQSSGRFGQSNSLHSNINLRLIVFFLGERSPDREREKCLGLGDARIILR